MRKQTNNNLILFTILIILINNINAEFQSLLIFTTRNEKEKGDENSPLSSDELEWNKINSFQSSINDFGQSFWKIYLLRGESDPLFKDIEKAIQYDDRTKVIVGNSQSQIIDKIFQSPFCWRKGKTEQLVFVMCNRKLEFPLDERGWKINEKIEIGGNIELKRKRREEEEIIIKKEKGKSIWIDLFKFSNVPMVVSATTTITKEEEKEENNKRKIKKYKKEIIIDEEEQQLEEEQNINKKHKRKSRKYNKKINDKENERDEINNEDKVKNEENEDINEEINENEGKNNYYEDKNKELEEEENEEELNEEELNEEKEEKEDDQEEKNEENNKYFNLLSIEDKKRKCHYRLSCYKNKGIIIPEKRNNGKEQENIISGKRTIGGTKLKIINFEKKSTLKDAAKLAIKKVRQKEAKGEVLREQYLNDGEQVLANFWSELERKNRCKYRRSCYKSGKLPKIKQSEILQWLGNIGGKGGFWKEEIKNIKKEEKIENMNEYERKLFCRYRRSCYEDGINRLNKTNDNISIKEFNFINIIKLIQEWLLLNNNNNNEEENKEEEDDLLKLKQKTKLECKYRKSCYKSGQLPKEFKFDKKEDKQTIEKILEGKKVPTSVKELKLFCKYRKSCYISNAAIPQIDEIEKNKLNNITIKSSNKKLNKSLKNSSPKLKEENKKFKKNSKIEEKDLNKKEEENNNNCFIDNLKKRNNNIKNIPQEGCSSNNNNNKINEENNKKGKKKKYIKIVEENEEKKEKKEEEIENKEEENKKENIIIEKNEELNIKLNNKKLDNKEEYLLFDWRILNNLLLINKQKPRKLDIEEWNKINNKEKLLRCRYRLSCYNKMNKIMKGLKKENIKEEIKENKEEKEENKYLNNYLYLNKNIKLKCKYRKSCYEKSKEEKLKTVKTTKKQKEEEEKTILKIIKPSINNNLTKTIINLEKCNKWRISCRQILGLPIKEKIPIGANGKKLCRKKKENEEEKAIK